MIEFLGLWERLHNPDFKPLEFEGFRKQAGANAFNVLRLLEYYIRMENLMKDKES